MLFYRPVIKADVPIIKILDNNNKKRDEDNNQAQIKQNLTNMVTNGNVTNILPLQNKNTKTNIEKGDNKKLNYNNHEEIIIRSNKYNSTDSIIEVKLPNPYFDTQIIKPKKYINFNIKSQFKSKYADYKKIKSSINEMENDREIKMNKTHKITKKFDKYIYFTNFSSSKKNQNNMSLIMKNIV